ncbi:flagellar hook-basal body complex protein FliE [Rosenbergiella nectarea]|uniref:Flagellar hook-basal body complex protein FliE n=1 Tax=Rosenbergiella nectarea TaxID=988801 RepID=A0A1H9HUU9_9GAMM|nr:flagellar hook-basal body complex protein FliE [Rosenbergiella nectarea]SEQ66129.1 flagellar hook-basal body complex protein FliE [Rosenbergiella nectarea]
MTTVSSINLTQPTPLSSTSSTGDRAEQPFSSVFSSMLNGISQYQDHAAQQVREVELGQSEVGINDLMVSIQKATVSLQLGVQVRNKMIAAYNEVMNMSV